MPEAIRTSESDHLLIQPRQRVADFVFSEDVVRVLPGMIKCFMPGYPIIVENIDVLGARFAQPGSMLYNLGYSFGAITQSLYHHVRNGGCWAIGVDDSHAMIERCSEYLHAQDVVYQELLPVELVKADILALDLQPTLPVTVNFTLQFATPDQHLGLLRRIRQTLLSGGVLILSKKLRFTDAQEHALLTDLHIASRRVNGYSELEIAQKCSALENVMLPDTFEEHRERLLAAGFGRVGQWLQCLDFASMIVLP